MDSTETVTLANWRRSPWNRWAFHHVSELVPVAMIPTDPSRAKPLPEELVVPNRLPDGASIDQVLRETETDGFLVLRDGTLIYEWYANGLGADMPHIVFSISKSISAILAGILVGQGKLDPDAPVTRYIPEVAGSAYADATVRHVLDMTVSIDFDESYLDPHGAFARYREAMGWNPVADPARTPGLHPFLTTLPRGSGPHGERFHYVSPNSDLLGWIIERAGGRPYAELLSDLIWKPMGAAHDAYITIDKAGASRSAGGICTTLRDLARFGELLRRGGEGIVPRAWIDDILKNGDRGAWTRGDMAALLPEGRYRSKWYLTGNDHGAWTAIGIHGQWLYIDPQAKLVIAKFSSQALPVDDPVDFRLLKFFASIEGCLA
ncbi:serine hydrolase domain-containing protein [Dongia sedimenti]|uniref:Serine hydrolase n=1 Tax=Dongia sedimenti TaxID=3064282 RepID=A0ABU0YLN6_9PROT|nr:serine hydrolase [Rhodospirillaceae bacterium R-7]